MKASFDAIAAAKTHTVVLEHYIPVKNAGKAGATKKVTTRVAKPVEIVVVEKPVEKYVEYTKKPEGIPGVIVPEEGDKKPAKKTAPKKPSKLKKLLRGKTVYDFS